MHIGLQKFVCDCTFPCLLEYMWVWVWICVCVCVCVHAWYSLPKTCCSPAYNTHHYTKDKVLLSNLMLMHPSKFKSGWLPNIPTTIRSLQPLLSLSLCRAFCLLHKSRDDSCLVLLLEDITEIQTYYQVKMQLMIILNWFNAHQFPLSPKWHLQIAYLANNPSIIQTIFN